MRKQKLMSTKDPQSKNHHQNSLKMRIWTPHFANALKKDLKHKNFQKKRKLFQQLFKMSCHMKQSSLIHKSRHIINHKLLLEKARKIYSRMAEQPGVKMTAVEVRRNEVQKNAQWREAIRKENQQSTLNEVFSLNPSKRKTSIIRSCRASRETKLDQTLRPREDQVNPRRARGRAQDQARSALSSAKKEVPHSSDKRIGDRLGL